MAKASKTLKASTALNLSGVERDMIAAVRAAIDAEKAGMAAEIAALQACAQDGAASKTYADLYKATVVAYLLSYGADDAGLIRAQALMAKGVKRSKPEQMAILAANARLSRRVIAAGLKAANTAGKKRTPKAPQEPAPKPVQKAVMAANPKTMAAPILANGAEWDTFLSGMAAFLRAARAKNAKGLDHIARDCVNEICAAVAKAEKRRAAK